LRPIVDSSRRKAGGKKGKKKKKEENPDVIPVICAARLFGEAQPSPLRTPLASRFSFLARFLREINGTRTLFSSSSARGRTGLAGKKLAMQDIERFDYSCFRRMLGSH